MENSQINSYHENEISLQELVSILIKSKKIIIFITLFFLLMASIFAFSLKPKFESFASVEIGNFNKEYYMINIQKFEFVNSSISVKKLTDTILVLTASNFLSSEHSEASLNEGIEYVLNISNNEMQSALADLKISYDSRIDGLEEELKNIYFEISTIDSQLDRLSKIDKSLPSSYGIETYLSELIIQKTKLKVAINLTEARKNALKEEALNLKYNSSKILKDIRTNEIKPNKAGFIVFGLLSGLILSILIVIVRSIFFRD